MRRTSHLKCKRRIEFPRGAEKWNHSPAEKIQFHKNARGDLNLLKGLGIILQCYGMQNPFDPPFLVVSCRLPIPLVELDPLIFWNPSIIDGTPPLSISITITLLPLLKARLRSNVAFCWAKRWQKAYKHASMCANWCISMFKKDVNLQNWSDL